MLKQARLQGMAGSNGLTVLNSSQEKQLRRSHGINSKENQSYHRRRHHW